MKKVLILIIVLLSLCACNGSNNYEVKKVSCEEKDQILYSDPNNKLIDVRSEDEYSENHLKDAINIPYDKIVEEISKNNDINYDTKIIVYCKSGKRSSIAAKTLKNAGYKNIYDLGSIENCE